MKNWLVRHDARNPPSWRTIQNQGLSKGSVMTHNLASRRSPSVRHDAHVCVTTDSAKLFCLEFQRQIQLLSSWRTNSASRRTVIVRHDAQPSVTTDSAKQFCFLFQRVFVLLSSWRTKVVRHDAENLYSPSRRTRACVMTDHKNAPSPTVGLHYIYSTVTTEI